MSFISRTLSWVSDRSHSHSKRPAARTKIPREAPNIPLPDPDEYSKADTCTLHALCSSCRRVLRASSHVKGTLFSFWRTTERITLWPSLEDLKGSVDNRCHFCTMVWQIISKDRDGQLRTEEEISSLGIRNVVLEISRPRDNIQINIACERLDMPGTGQIRLYSRDERKRLPADTCHPSQSWFLTSSNEHKKLARYWFQECSSKHQFCRRSDSVFMPTRLIQIDDTDSTLIKVISSAESSETIPYCTLSHSWGGATDILTLTSKNLSDLFSLFSIQRLPRTFRDAIDITQWLGHRHLWIDCLCIVQDLDEDWTFEASRMSSVYENSSCNIAAMTGTTPHHGCFERRDPLSFSPCRVATSHREVLYASTTNRPAGDPFTADMEYLNTRGWVLQERIFSPRILCLTRDGMFWSCRAGCAFERDQNGRGDSSDRGLKDIFGSTVTAVDWVPRGDDIRTDSFEDLLSYCRPTDARTLQMFTKYWYIVVAQYSTRDLTFSTDKLIAISSIANRIQ